MAETIKKSNILLGSAIHQGKGQTVCQADIIVPDSMPDILKILQVEGKAVTDSRVISKDKISVRGKVNCNIIYLPENMGKIKSIEYSVPFSYAQNVKGAEEDMAAQIECEVVHLEYQMLNSRKISIKAIVETDERVIGKQNIEYISEVENESAQVRKKHIIGSSTEVCLSKEFSIAEKISLPSAECVIKTNSAISKQEFKVINNKIVVKGEAGVNILYITTGGSYECKEAAVPFTEILEAPGLNEKLEVTAEMKVKECKGVLSSSSDGTDLLWEMTAAVCICGEENVEFDALTDIYDTEENIVPKISIIKMNKKCGNKTLVNNLREIITLDDGKPGVEKVYALQCALVPAEINISEDEIKGKFEVKCCITYISDKEEEKVEAAEFTLPLEISAENISGCKKARILPKVKECTAVNAGKGFETAITIETEIIPLEEWEEEIVTDIEYAEKTSVQRAAIVLYYVQKGDSIWEIAKKYQSKIKDIEEINKISSDQLMPGQMLLIPKN